MTESHLDGLLDALVRAEPRGSWDDVLQRARRAQRRYVAVVVAIAALVLAPATWAAVHAFEGTPAPPPIRHNFVFTNRLRARESARFGKDFPQAEASKAHGVLQVRTRSGALDLWAAPSTQGGSCFFVDWEAGILKGLVSGAGGCMERGDPPLAGGTLEGGGPSRYAALYGSALDSAVKVRVALTNGRTVSLPVVEHYFLGVVRSGIAVVNITALDASGKVVARWKSP
ncbi:MAG TPA: hypothetical protein VFA37_10440 [Gaiellaceae bacterium]|nr:hypothetical protein [Gaiellaceae bacterium]